MPSDQSSESSLNPPLALADQNWHEGANNPKPFIKYMLGVILECYRDFETRIDVAWRSGEKSSSYDVVKTYALQTIGTFAKQDALVGCLVLAVLQLKQL